MFARINLVPQEPFSARLKILVPVILVAGIILASVTIYLQDRLVAARIARVEEETTRIQLNQAKASADLARLQALAAELDGLQKRKDVLQDEVGKIEAVRSKKRNYYLALNTIAQLLPDSLRCEKIVFRQNQGIIDGLAVHLRDLPLLVRSLQDSQIFRSASLSEIDKGAASVTAPLNFRIMVELEQ